MYKGKSHQILNKYVAKTQSRVYKVSVVQWLSVCWEDVGSSPGGAAFENFCKETSYRCRKILG